MTKGNPWPDEHSEALRLLVAGRSGSYSDYAKAINKQFGTNYSRLAAIGRGQRLGLKQPNPQKARAPDSTKSRNKRLAQERREKRWAENPSLKQRYQRLAEKKTIAAQMLAGGAKKTSPVYRKHLPYIPPATKNELRAMLTIAVQNTAAMEVT